MEDFGKEAYIGYGESVGWKNIRGESMPAWEQLPTSVQLAWKSAAQVVIFKTLADSKKARVEAESFIAPITTI